MDRALGGPCDRRRGSKRYATNPRHSTLILRMFLCGRFSCSSHFISSSKPSLCRTMAAVRSNLAHEDRTVAEPRQGDIHSVVLSKIERVNNDIKLFKLSIQDKEKGVKVGQIKVQVHRVI